MLSTTPSVRACMYTRVPCFMTAQSLPQASCVHTETLSPTAKTCASAMARAGSGARLPPADIVFRRMKGGSRPPWVGSVCTTFKRGGSENQRVETEVAGPQEVGLATGLLETPQQGFPTVTFRWVLAVVPGYLGKYPENSNTTDTKEGYGWTNGTRS